MLYRLLLTAAVHHLCLAVNRSTPAPHVNICGIYIYSRRTEIAIERQGLIDIVHNMEPDILVDAAVVAVEILIVPLER